MTKASRRIYPDLDGETCLVPREMISIAGSEHFYGSRILASFLVNQFPSYAAAFKSTIADYIHERLLSSIHPPPSLPNPSNPSRNAMQSAPPTKKPQPQPHPLYPVKHTHIHLQPNPVTPYIHSHIYIYTPRTAPHRTAPTHKQTSPIQIQIQIQIQPNPSGNVTLRYQLLHLSSPLLSSHVILNSKLQS